MSKSIPSSILAFLPLYFTASLAPMPNHANPPMAVSIIERHVPPGAELWHTPFFLNPWEDAVST